MNPDSIYDHYYEHGRYIDDPLRQFEQHATDLGRQWNGRNRGRQMCCPVCGCEVMDARRHGEWHIDQDRKLNALVDDRVKAMIPKLAVNIAALITEGRIKKLRADIEQIM